LSATNKEKGTVYFILYFVFKDQQEQRFCYKRTMNKKNKDFLILHIKAQNRAKDTVLVYR